MKQKNRQSEKTVQHEAEQGRMAAVLKRQAEADVFLPAGARKKPDWGRALYLRRLMQYGGAPRNGYRPR